jgi:hypothetical protein
MTPKGCRTADSVSKPRLVEFEPAYTAAAERLPQQLIAPACRVGIRLAETPVDVDAPQAVPVNVL